MARWFQTLAAIVMGLGMAPAWAAPVSPGGVALPLALDELLTFEAQFPGIEPLSSAGFSVALSDDGLTALVGAPFEDCAAGADCGAVHVLVRVNGTWTEQTVLTASDALNGDEFGTSVALSGDGSIALIGALRADCATGTECGSAYLFTRSGSTWSEAQELTAADLVGADFFGLSVDLSLDGSTALVGAPSATCGGQLADCGAAYVFERAGGIWILETRLAPSMPVGSDLFGNSVSLSDDGEIALIGSPVGGCAGQACGEAYVFVRNGVIWTEERRFTSVTADPGDQFAHAVSLSSDGSVALLGAISDDCPAGPQCGAAYIFARNGGLWTESAKFTSLDNSGNDAFGIRLSLAGDASHALVVAFGGCVGNICELGYLFVEENGVWQEKQRLTATRQCAGGQFQGLSAALSENADRALIGMHFSTCPAEPGEAFLFGHDELVLIEVPALNGAGLAALAVALAALGAALLRR